MSEEELKKELENLKDFKLYVFERDVYVRAEDYKEKAIENRKLKEKLSEITMVADDEKQSIEHILELEEENRNLKAIIDHYKKFEEGKKKLEGMLMEEDTLQELRDIGEI